MFNFFEEKRILVGTTVKPEASIFYVKKSECPGEFNIAFYGNSEDDHHNEPVKYLALNKEALEEPLEIRRVSRPPANLTLQYPSGNKEASIDLWEKEACYVKEANQEIYLALFINSNGGEYSDHGETKCVTTDEDGKNNTWLKFQLHRENFDREEDALYTPKGTKFVDSDEETD